MSNSNIPKKHHYVPQCYLKNFMENHCFYTLDIRKVQGGYNEFPRRNQPKKICYIEDFYTIDPEYHGTIFGLEAYDRLSIETTILNRLENGYSKIFNQLKSKLGTLRQPDVIHLCDFIIQLKLRNPYWLKETIDKNKEVWIEEAVDKLRSKYIYDPRFEHIPLQLKNLLIDAIHTDNKKMLNFSKQMQLHSLIMRYSDQTARNEKFRNVIANCEWIIFEAPEDGPYFITSDNPGVSQMKDGLYYNTNFSEGFMFFFPLSKNLCLVISDSKMDNCLKNQNPVKEIVSGTVDAETVIRINDSTIQCISKLLVASDTWYLSQIAQRNKPKKKE